MLKTALIAYIALLVPTTVVVLALCKTAARGDRMTAAAIKRGRLDGQVSAQESAKAA